MKKHEWSIFPRLFGRGLLVVLDWRLQWQRKYKLPCGHWSGTHDYCIIDDVVF